jgi:Tfp pilus assembly protein PilE
MRRMRVRTLMIVVAVVGLLLGAVGPGRAWYRRWTYHRAQAAVFGRMEVAERLRAALERRLSIHRTTTAESLLRKPDFASKSLEERERIIDATIEFHRVQYAQAEKAAGEWEEKRLLEETAAWWCWDPFAPEVP